MSSQSVRILLVLLAAGLVAIGTYSAWALDQERLLGGRAAREFDRLAEQAIQRLGELQHSQQAYVAAGQGAALWMSRADTALAAVATDLDRLRQVATDEVAVSSLGAATQVIDTFVQSDRRVRDYARNGQMLMASDIIFTDGVEMTAGAAGHIAAARDGEQAARDEHEAGLRRRQFSILAALGTTAFVALAGLAAGWRRQSRGAIRPAPHSVVSGEKERPANRPADDPRAADPAETASIAAVRGDDPHLPPAPGEPLKALATLCGDLARVQELGELVTSLERAAALLHAAGIVVWLADPSGQELRPALAHGYAPETLARIPSLARDDRNATALAFRDAAMQIVTGSPGAFGALALPIMAGSSCVGVLAAEMREGGEAMETRQALASVIAAQLSSLAVTPTQEEHAPVHWSSGA